MINEMTNFYYTQINVSFNAAPRALNSVERLHSLGHLGPEPSLNFFFDTIKNEILKLLDPIHHLSVLRIRVFAFLLPQ